ncbi:MAG: Hint domain-containing protein, partial [Oligoflexales bacterium]
KVILGDRNALQSRTKKVAVDNLKVEGNAETHTSATAQDSADVKSSSFTGSLDVTATSGTAKLEKSTVDGDASVYGQESTTVSNNTFGGSQRVGYQAVLKDGKPELRKSKSTKFTKNKNAAKNKASQKVSIFGENVSHSQNRDYADTGEVSILADRRTTLGADSLRKARQLNEDTKSDISAQNGNTHNLMAMKSLSLDQHGNFTSKKLSKADLDHNREMARLANMLKYGFSGAEKTLMPTKLGITAYISGDNAEGVSVLQEILPGIDQIRVDGKNFYLPGHLTLRVANFASFAKKNEIRGKLLHKQIAIFMTEDGGESEETYFAENSQVGEGDSQTEVVSKKVKIGGKVRGKSLDTKGQDIEYLESADRQLEVETNAARNSLEDYGRRTALSATDISEKSIKYSTSHHTSILEDGIMSVSAPSVKIEGNETSEDKRISLGKNAHLTIGGGLSSTDDENAYILPSRKISIKGSIHGDEGSKITLVSEYLDNKGLVDAGEVLAIAERITLNGTFEGNKVSVNADWLKGLGTVKAHNKLTTSIGEDWAPGEGGSLKLESGGDLTIHLPHNNPNQLYRPTRLDLEHVHAGGVLYIAGALDSQYVRRLMTGSLGMNRSNNVSAKKLHIETSDPVVMIDRNIKVEFEDSELKCNNFVMNKDAVLETNHFRLDAINLIQKSGAIIDSGKDNHNIRIDVQNMFQVYDFDGYAEPDDKIKYNLNEEGLPQDFKPAEIRAGGELNIFAHNKVDLDNPDVKGSIFSLGGQFISRHENIMMKSEGSIYIMPITKIQHLHPKRPSKGRVGKCRYNRFYWDDHYDLYREKITTRALFRSAKNVSIEAESGELMDVRLSRQAKTNLNRGTKPLFEEEHKNGSGPSPIGQGLIMGVKIGSTVAAGIFFGPGTAAKLYTALSTVTFNSAIDISINRSSGGLRSKDEWRIARNNLKSGAISFGANFMYDGLSDQFGDSLKQSALNATEGLKYSAEMMQYAEVIVETITKNVFREGLSALLDQRSMDWDSLISQTPDDILDSVIALGIGKLTGEIVNNADLQLDDAFSIGAKHVIDDMLADVAGHLARNETVHTDQILQRALDSSINELANVVGSTIGQKLKENKDALDDESPLDLAFEEDERFQQLVADTESILNIDSPTDGGSSGLPTIPEEENEDQLDIDDSGNDIEPGQSDLKLDARSNESNNKHEIQPVQGLKEDPNPEVNLQNEQPSSPIGMTEEDHEFQVKLQKQREKDEQLKKKLEFAEDNKTCFSLNTLVLTPQGGLKAMGEIEEGDLVLSCNFKHCQEARVTRVHHFELKEVLDLKTSVGTFTVTPDHPIYHISDPEDICEQNANVKDAELFKLGDHLLTAAFDLANVNSIDGKRRYSPVVELSIEKNHNFYVVAPDSNLKQDVYSRAILVHNCGGDEELIHPAKNLDELGNYTDGQKDGYEFAFDVYTNLPSGAGVVVAAKEAGKQGAKYGAKEAAKKAGKELAKEGAKGAEREAGKKVVEHVKDHKKKVDAGNSNSGIIVNRKGPIPDQVPHNLKEQIVLRNAREGGGEIIMKKLADKPRLVDNYGQGRWVKMEDMHIAPDGRQINVHWFKNLDTGKNVEFKFKYRYNDGIGAKKPLPEPKVPPFVD